MKQSPYTIKSTKPVYQNPWIHIREDHVTHIDNIDQTFGIVTIKDGTTIIPIDDEHNIYLAHEFKYAQQEYILEGFGGGIEEGEDPTDAAIRELYEESGMQAQTIIPYGFVIPYTTIVRGRDYCFVAKDLTFEEKMKQHGEHVETVKMPLTEALKKIENSEITHSATVSTLLRYVLEVGT